MYGKSVKAIWERFVESYTVDGKTRRTGNPGKLGRGELNLIEAMKTQKPSVSYKVIAENVHQHGDLPAGTSISSISRAVRESMLEGKFSWKRMSRLSENKFTDQNIDYCQDFFNYMCEVDPYRLKFFDESGVSLYDSNKRYGHSAVNHPCVEVGKHINSPNVTLNLLAGLEGILYANTLDGASNTVDFLNFFNEAGNNVQRNGAPVLANGDIIVLDNCPTHHNAGGFALAQWLETLGIIVVYLPTYSPELNPVELAFNKLKIVLKTEELQPLVHANHLHAAIYAALDTITEHDMLGFCRSTDYIFV